MAFTALTTHKETIHDMRSNGATLEDIAAHLKQRFQVQTSVATLSRFLKAEPVAKAPNAFRQAPDGKPHLGATRSREMHMMETEIAELREQLRNAASTLLDAQQNASNRVAELERALVEKDQERREETAQLRKEFNRQRSSKKANSRLSKPARPTPPSPRPSSETASIPRPAPSTASSQSASSIDRLLAGEKIVFQPPPSKRRLRNKRPLWPVAILGGVGLMVIAIAVANA